MNAVIADQDSDDRTVLVELCHTYGGFNEVVVVGSGSEAVHEIRANRPQVALLACELDDMSGFEVLRALDPGQRPPTILVARDDRYAADALQSTAADYLTRPISPHRLALALKRVCSGAPTSAKLPIACTEPVMSPGDRLVGERAGRIYFIVPSEIDYIEADSNYVRISVGPDRYINRDSIKRLAALLERQGFLRISRAVLINLQRVAFAEREGAGVLAFVLYSGARLVSSAGMRLEAGALLRIARTRGTRRKAALDCHSKIKT